MPSHERLIPLPKAGHAASDNSEWRNWHSAPVKCALRAISSGLNGDCAGRSKPGIAGYEPRIIKHPAQAGTAPCPSPARPTQAHSHAGGQAGAQPKLYNPRHPERALLYQTIAEHFDTWLELASAGQSGGQGDHHTPKP